MLKTIKNIDIEIPGLKIISKIGDGGMSVVYLAEQISLKRKVAVKVMRMEIAKNDLDIHRFKHEAKTIAQLDHPSIISIYNIGQTKKGEIYFTMPYLNHGDLSNFILEDEQEFINLLIPICDGLAFAHNRGVVHRDIKPENLLFDKFGNIVIADFGIAISKEGSRMTKEHQIVGSAQYMSPEQARSLKVAAPTDIYSLGIVIYERITGDVPFDSEDSISILVNHVSMEPPKLPSKMRHWQELIDKCLAKSPSDRFTSMLELKQAIKNIPTNSIQRTSSSIQRVLNNDKGKHLKWFIPLFVLMFFFGLYKMFTPNDSTLDVIQKVVQTDTVRPKKPPQESVIQNNNLSQTNLESNQNGSVTSDITDTSQSSIQIKTITENNETVDLTEYETKTQASEQTIENTKVAIFETPDINQTEIVQDELLEVGNQILDNTVETNDLALTEEMIAAEKQQQISVLLDKAQINTKKYRLSRPANNNATDQFLEVLKLDIENEQAHTGLEKVGGKYYQLVLSAIKKSDFNKALKHSLSFDQFNKKIKYSNKNLEPQKNQILKIIANIDVTPKSFSTSKLNTLEQIIKIYTPEHPLIAKYQLIAKQKLGPQIGEKLMDESGIETVLISKKLAVMTHEITVEEFNEFANNTAHKSSKCKHIGGGVSLSFSKKAWNKPYFKQTLNHPVTCVTVDEAKDYARWVSKKTSNNYRLPTKSEWLLLAANDKNNFTACKTANVTGTEAKKIRNKQSKYTCNDNYKFTAPVASFKQNSLSLYDIQGNVSEWIACDGKPCNKPIAMGSSWFDGESSNKLDKIESKKPSLAFSHIGFRLVREL